MKNSEEKVLAREGLVRLTFKMKGLKEEVVTKESANRIKGLQDEGLRRAAFERRAHKEKGS